MTSTYVVQCSSGEDFTSEETPQGECKVDSED